MQPQGAAPLQPPQPLPTFPRLPWRNAQLVTCFCLNTGLFFYTLSFFLRDLLHSSVDRFAYKDAISEPHLYVRFMGMVMDCRECRALLSYSYSAGINRVKDCVSFSCYEDETSSSPGVPFPCSSKSDGVTFAVLAVVFYAGGLLTYIYMLLEALKQREFVLYLSMVLYLLFGVAAPLTLALIASVTVQDMESCQRSKFWSQNQFVYTSPSYGYAFLWVHFSLQTMGLLIWCFARMGCCCCIISCRHKGALTAKEVEERTDAIKQFEAQRQAQSQLQQAQAVTCQAFPNQPVVLGAPTAWPEDEEGNAAP